MVLSADVEWNDGRRHSIKPYQLFRKRKPQKHKHLWKLSFNLPLLLRNMTVTRGIRSVTLRAELQSELFGKQGQNRQELLLVPPEDPFQVRSRTFFWHTYYVNTRQHLRNFCRWHVIRKAILMCWIFKILRNIYFDSFSMYKTETANRADTAAWK